jgi:hypothetical protein
MADMPKVVTAKLAARFVGLSESTSDADARFLKALTAAHPR